MSNVEFSEETQYNKLDPFERQKVSKFAGWIMSTGLAKNEKQANVVLFIIALVIIGISLYIAFK